MAPSLLGTYNLGGSAVTALVQLAFGPVGAVLGVGSQLVLRYLGQMKANKIQEDLTFEEAFLVSYACPRCKESFQKKPWVTIRDCGKCKTKYRL